VAADPAFVLGVLGMATIGQTLEEVGIAVGAADILRWSCASAVDTSGDEQLLELDKVMPVIAEVVDVHEWACMRQSITRQKPALEHSALRSCAGS
jgi:hypothetical protein